MKRHLGGTLLGFIIGLLVGLGVALAVAVYVTKVPVPLVDRGVQRKPGQDAIEAERNKDWNPNAALSSRPAAPPAPAEATAPAGSAPAAAPAPAQAPSPAPAATDPLGELIQQRTTSPGPVASVQASDPFTYFVQVGAFRGADEAEAQRARLAMLGFDAKVSEREQAGRPVFRVRLGPYSNKADAEQQQERLKGQGLETALVRVQP